MKLIVVPTDFSEASEASLAEAVELARSNSAELLLLHVIQDVHTPTRQVLKMRSFPNFADEVRKNVEQSLAELRAKVPDGVTCRTRVVEGIPSAEIADVAASENADLIVIPSHSRSGIKRLFVGSTTERLVRVSPCSVLVTRSRS